jgi:hypothetical protein
MLALPRACWCLASLSLATCSDAPIDPPPACASVRVLDVPVLAITRSGYTLDASWRVGVLGPTGSHAPLVELDHELVSLARAVAFEHDPQSGRMWVSTWSFDEGEPALLLQFDASGQLDWSEPLDTLGRVGDVSLYQHEGALFVATRVQPEGALPSLRVERRDAAGVVQWTNAALLGPFDEPMAMAELRGVVEDTLVLVATPPHIDSGPSYALALELEPARSLLRAATASGTTLVDETQVEWPAGFGADQHALDIELAPLGDRIASFVQGNGVLGLTLHARSGELECQRLLDVPVLGLLGLAQALDGREQVAILVEAARLDDVADLAILLVE